MDDPRLSLKVTVTMSASLSAIQILTDVSPPTDIVPPKTSHTGAPQLSNRLTVTGFDREKQPANWFTFDPTENPSKLPERLMCHIEHIPAGVLVKSKVKAF